MPLYDYECRDCGSFTEFRPVAAFEEDAVCPDCGRASPRQLLCVPHFGAGSGRFRAQGVNEKNSHAPETTKRTGKHPPKCSCCRKTPARKTSGPRPWMLSH
jgi:putative FmdB family regulatory protein